MSEEKLTVAELMARAAKEGHSTDAPRRRRRRSLEDGGVSVAELTGSIPAVKEKPAESKHSAVKIDDPAGIQDTTRDDAAPAPEPADAPAEVKAAAEPVEQTKQAKPVAPAAPVTPVAPVAPEKAEPKKPEPQAVAKAEPKPAAKAEAKQEPKAEKKAEPESTPAAKPTVERPAPSNEETMVLSIVDEKDPIRLTTGAFPVVPASAVKPAPAPKTPAKAKDAEAAADAEFASTTPGGQRSSSPADTTQMDATTGEIEVTDTADEHPDEGSGKVSVVSVILMAIVGVVLGAAVFLAFEMLWERLSTWLVAVLAVAVTLGMVGIVHALRTSRDGFSMALAGVVGLVMTFGPLLIVI